MPVSGHGANLREHVRDGLLAGIRRPAARLRSPLPLTASLTLLLELDVEFRIVSTHKAHAYMMPQFGAFQH